MARVAQRCLISLGRLAFAQGDYTTAEAALRHAVAAGKAMRVPLPAGEILAAFARERVAPFAELARLCLDDPRGSRVAEAFGYVEAGRARAFLEMLGGAPQLLPAGYQPDPANLERACELRVEQLALSRLAAPQRRPAVATRPGAAPR